MANGMGNLWPDDITVKVVTPLAILRAQATKLGELTEHLLDVDINSDEAMGKTGQTIVIHRFEIVAPALDYRHTLFTCRHLKQMVYPAYIDSEYFDSDDPEPWSAGSQDSFVQGLSLLFKSNAVRGIIQSLIAQSNELREQPAAV